MYLRSTPRINVTLPAEVESIPSLSFTVTMLSAGGGCIEGEFPAGEEGEAVPIAFMLENRLIRAHARLKNVRVVDGWASCGFAFENLSFEDANDLHDFLSDRLLSVFCTENS